MRRFCIALKEIRSEKEIDKKEKEKQNRIKGQN